MGTFGKPYFSVHIIVNYYIIYIFLCLAIELEVAIKSNEIHVCIIAVS